MKAKVIHIGKKANRKTVWYYRVTVVIEKAEDNILYNRKYTEVLNTFPVTDWEIEVEVTNF
jgi:hypothetical protein